ncbi:MAG: hypothetical protein ACK4GT_06510 [Pararhodobacter sp.]
MSHDRVSDPFGGLTLKTIALGMAVFGASMLGIGRALPVAQAQSAVQTEIALILPLADLRMTESARNEVLTTLRGMSDTDLRLTYARLCATFRAHIGDDDLSLARALVDYALLTEAEMDIRGVPRPAGTDAARELLKTYELVL